MDNARIVAELNALYNKLEPFYLGIGANTRALSEAPYALGYGTFGQILQSLRTFAEQVEGDVGTDAEQALAGATIAADFGNLWEHVQNTFPDSIGDKAQRVMSGAIAHMHKIGLMLEGFDIEIVVPDEPTRRPRRR